MVLVKAHLFTPLMVFSVGGDEKTKKHLETLGVTRGVIIELLSKECGSVIFRVHGSRLALDHKTAELIEVNEINS